MYKMSLRRNIESSDHIHSSLQSSPQTKFYIMHYQTLILALFASAAMAKKGPWVSSFASDTCSGDGAGDAVEMMSEACAPFHPVYDSIGVNFGGGYQVRSISVFWDGDCKNPAGKNITADLGSGLPQQCISMRYWGAKWGSVQVTNGIDQW